MVKRGHEVDIEYSKKTIMNKISILFGEKVVEKLNFSSFNEEKKSIFKEERSKMNVTNDKYKKKIDDVKNKKIKKSLLELTKVFKQK